MADNGRPDEEPDFGREDFGPNYYGPEAEPEEVDPNDPRFSSKWRKTNGGKPSSHHYEWEPLEINQPYLVKKRLPRVGVGALIAHGYVGKTESAIDLVAALITDRPWAGARIVRPGGVIFFNAEGGKGPLRSWHAVKDLVIKPMFDHEGQAMPAAFPFDLVTDTRPLLKNKVPDQEAIKWYLEQIEETKAVFQKKFGIEVVLAIFETLAKIARFKDENDNAECTNAFQALDEISQRADLFCLATDHLPKDEAATKARGGSAKYDSADSIMRISRGAGDARRMHVDKVRGDEHGMEIPFNLTKVVRGVDSDGDPITAVRITWLNENQSYNKKPGPEPKQKNEVLSCLDWAHELGKSERIHTPHHGSVFAAPGEEIRAEWTRRVRVAGQTEKSISDGWNRAVRQVVKDNLVGTYEIEGKGNFMFRVQRDEMRRDATR